VLGPFGTALLTVQAVGMACNAADAALAGNYGTAALLLAGTVLVALRGWSQCGSVVNTWATRGLIGLGVVGAGRSLVSAYNNFTRPNGDPIAGVLDLLDAGAGLYSLNRVLDGACFRWGTPLLTPDGDRRIEEFEEGDAILTRSESDPEGGVEVKRVEKVFVALARVLEVRVRGRVIGTTAEHPFHVSNKGWVAARALRVGDVLRSHDGQQLVVEGVRDTGKWETVYNLRVADYHTYFVGAREWGFSVWAHNACTNAALSATRRAAAQARWARHRAAVAAGQRGTPAGRGPAHTAVQRSIRQNAGGRLERDVKLTNGNVRIADVIDARGRIHQVGDMRTRGGLRPAGRERAAIEDIRKAVGPNRTIIFHDKNGRLPSLINPDLQPGWRAAPRWRRMDP
jgi:hypothetical protein